MERVWNIKWTRNGGLTFLRLGRFQFSFCLCSHASTAKAFPSQWVMPPISDLNQLPHRFQQLQRTLVWAYGDR